jgi:hypothetical protein
MFPHNTSFLSYSQVLNHLCSGAVSRRAGSLHSDLEGRHRCICGRNAQRPRMIGIVFSSPVHPKSIDLLLALVTDLSICASLHSYFHAPRSCQVDAILSPEPNVFAESAYCSSSIPDIFEATIDEFFSQPEVFGRVRRHEQFGAGIDDRQGCSFGVPVEVHCSIASEIPDLIRQRAELLQRCWYVSEQRHVTQGALPVVYDVLVCPESRHCEGLDFSSNAQFDILWELHVVLQS